MAYLLGIIVTGTAIWAFLHDGKQPADQAKRDWQIVGILIIALGTLSGTLLL